MSAQIINKYLYMGLGLSLSFRLAQAQKLTLGQRLLLKKALALRLELREPSFPNPVRGMEGILAADEILKETGAVGLLIGGLAEAVWNRRRTEDELAAHKDVDVMVMPPAEPFEKFTGGIDWWNPYNVHFDSIKTQLGSMENVNRTFWSNGNGCTLRYRVDCESGLEPGIYIPTPELATDIRVSECMASIDESVAVIDDVDGDPDHLVDSFRKKLGIRSHLPRFISQALGRIPVPYVTSQNYLHHPFRVTHIPLEEQRAFNSAS
jgi:hypothetical protein